MSLPAAVLAFAVPAFALAVTPGLDTALGGFGVRLALPGR